MPVVEYEKRERVAYVNLNRPEAMNALNPEVGQALTEAFDDIESDDDILAVILSGNGGKAFCAGMDLKWRAQEDAAGHELSMDNMPNLGFQSVQSCSKPIIAAIDGFCLAGGMQMASRCDIRVATEASRFGMPEARRALTAVGIIDTPEVFFPPGEASLILLTGAHYPAKRTYEMGFVQALLPDRDSMLVAAESIANEIKQCAPLAVAAIKAVLKTKLDMPTPPEGKSTLAHLLQVNSDRLDRNARSEDRLEGPLAFAEKRVPNWKNR